MNINEKMMEKLLWIEQKKWRKLNFVDKIKSMFDFISLAVVAIVSTELRIYFAPFKSTSDLLGSSL